MSIDKAFKKFIEFPEGSNQKAVTTVSCKLFAEWHTKQLQERINELEHWIAGIADDHAQIPDWIQQSARSLLAEESE